MEEYYFLGPIHVIEDFTGTEVNPIYLGRLIRYISIPHGSDWLIDGKAIYEKGTISKGSYENIIGKESILKMLRLSSVELEINCEKADLSNCK